MQWHGYWPSLSHNCCWAPKFLQTTTGLIHTISSSMELSWSVCVQWHGHWPVRPFRNSRQAPTSFCRSCNSTIAELFVQSQVLWNRLCLSMCSSMLIALSVLQDIAVGHQNSCKCYNCTISGPIIHSISTSMKPSWPTNSSLVVYIQQPKHQTVDS